MGGEFNVGSVVATVKADTDDFKRGMNEAKDLSDGLKSKLSGVGGAISSIAKQSALFAGIVGGAGVIAIKDSIKAYQEQENAIKQQETVLKSTHHAAGLYLQDLQDQASAYQRLTPFADEAITAGQNILLTFTQIKGPIMQKATETILDMSQALGQDLKSSAIQLGKALNDPIQGVTALRRVGVSFNDQQLEQIATMQKSGDIMGAQSLILRELTTEFGGSAKAAGETFAGKMAIMNNQIGELKEGIGKLILEALAPLVDWITKVVQGQQFIDFMAKLEEAFQKVGAWITEHKEEVITFLKGLAIALGALLIIGTIAIAIGVLMNPITWLVGAIILLYSLWERNFFGIRDITTDVVNWIKDHFEQLKATAEFIFNAVTAYIRIAFTIIQGIFKVALALIKGDWSGAWEAIKETFQKVWGIIKGLFDSALNMIKSWAGDVFESLTKPFSDAWNRIKDTMNKIRDALDFTKRHSPSVIDIIHRGVNLANDAFENLAVPIPEISPVVNNSNMGGGPAYVGVNIDMSNAIISDEAGAERMGELIGDKIIDKFDKSYRH